MDLADAPPALLVRRHLHIAGDWVDPADGGTIPVENPATGEVLGQVPAGTPADEARAAGDRVTAAYTGIPTS
ncbi:hypothetical protein GCM10027452_40790 [Micromonospora halotolerans]